MDTLHKPRHVEVLLYEGVNVLDVSGPSQAFDVARSSGRRVYTLRFVSPDGKPVRASCGVVLGADARLTATNGKKDLIIPGGQGVDAMLMDEGVLSKVQSVAARSGGRRMISICSGALILAAAGVLDGKEATTHWCRAAQTREFGTVKWNLDRIFVRDGDVFSSAGVTTGIDLALSIIRADYGAKTALNVARDLVVQMRRVGGQSQYSMHIAGQVEGDDSFARLIETIVSDPRRDWTLNAMAEAAAMHPRTLSRTFSRRLDLSPGVYVEQVRLDHARGAIEDGVSLKQAAVASGFGDVQRMRRAFNKQLGTNPVRYAEAFR